MTPNGPPVVLVSLRFLHNYIMRPWQKSLKQKEALVERGYCLHGTNIKEHQEFRSTNCEVIQLLSPVTDLIIGTGAVFSRRTQ